MPDFTPDTMMIFYTIIVVALFTIDTTMHICGWGPYKNCRSKKKEKEMKFWNKKRKLTATDDFVDFVLMKLYEEPSEWARDKYGSDVLHWRYKDICVYVGFTNLGELQDGKGEVSISGRQSKLIARATENMRSTQALNRMMKAAVKNTT